MIPYAAPLADMRFVIEDMIGLEGVRALPGHEDATDDLMRQVLDEAGRLASDVFAPLNRVGDIEGCVLENGVVTTPKGFREAYRAFTDGGWNGAAFDPDYGGMGLPLLVSTATAEIWASANLALSLCPILTQAGVELLTAHGSDAQKETYLPKLISGEWSGSMVMTEPHAGTDIGELRTRAVRDGDHFRLSGQKIFISWGEHDMADNVIHMVLGRAEDSPPGVKGLSLFIVPKFLVNDDGSLGHRNDIRAVTLEHKLGINASPTAVMAYGEDEGAVAYLIGEQNRGIEYMFTMMNNARLSVGLQGVALAERAYQQARDYAVTRIQGRDIADPGAGQAAIIRHPDVRRNLMTMRAGIEAARALAYTVAAWLDTARRHPDADVRQRHQARVDLLIPIVKAWTTDFGFEATSIGVQIHGGMGFMEETGAAQHLRDARIPMIYEGTNGIQALDLMRRKVIGDHGETIAELIAEMRETGAALAASGHDDIINMGAALADGIDALERVTEWMLEAGKGDVRAPAAGATPYLNLFGTVMGGHMMARAGLLAAARLDNGGEADPFHAAKLATMRFYAENFLPRAAAFERAATTGADAVMALADEQF